MKPRDGIIAEDEINLYDYWKVLVKRKKLFLGIFFVPLIIITIIILTMPRYYIGERELTIIPVIPTDSNAPLAITAPNIVSFIGNIDDTQKRKIFANHSGFIKSVIISISRKSMDTVNITINAKTADILPQATKNLFDYIINLPEIKEKITQVNEETDLKLKNIIEEIDLKLPKLIEAQKTNLAFLSDISDMIKKRELTIVTFNPSDLVKKDAELSVEIMRLRKEKIEAMKKRQLLVAGTNLAPIIKKNGDLKNTDLSIENENIQNIKKFTVAILGPLSVTKQPSNTKIKQIIIVTGILSIMAVIIVVLFLGYIERMKALENEKM